jgi:hypothetical protein
MAWSRFGSGFQEKTGHFLRNKVMVSYEIMSIQKPGLPSRSGSFMVRRGIRLIDQQTRIRLESRFCSERSFAYSRPHQCQLRKTA